MSDHIDQHLVLAQQLWARTTKEAAKEQIRQRLAVIAPNEAAALYARDGSPELLTRLKTLAFADPVLRTLTIELAALYLVT